MKRTVLVAIASVAMAGMAHAADISRPLPPIAKAPAYVPAPLFSWTGLYIGANVGYGWSDGSGTACIPALGCAATSIPITGDGDGFFGGVQAGYNWQVGSFVYGVEADFQLSAGEGTLRTPALGGVTLGTIDNEWFGTIRGRLGYAMDRWLFYVTGGAVVTHNKFNSAVAGISNASATGWTWTIGGGIEAALWQNWSIKGEYLYIATPHKVPEPTVGGFATSIDGDVDTHLIRVGLNYRF